MRAPDATTWDGINGNDRTTDPKAVERMASAVIQKLTGEDTDGAAWSALVRHFNRTRKLGDSGYQRGRKRTEPGEFADLHLPTGPRCANHVIIRLAARYGDSGFE